MFLKHCSCVHILQLSLCYCCYVCTSIPPCVTPLIRTYFKQHVNAKQWVKLHWLCTLFTTSKYVRTYICVLPQQRMRSADSSTASPNHTLHLTEITIQQASLVTQGKPNKSCGTGLADMACETCSFCLHRPNPVYIAPQGVTFLCCYGSVFYVMWCADALMTPWNEWSTQLLLCSKRKYLSLCSLQNFKDIRGF